MTSLEEKLDKLRLEYLSHGALVVKRPQLAKQLGRKFLQLCPNKTSRLAEYFCCLNCGLPRAHDMGGRGCAGCGNRK